MNIDIEPRGDDTQPRTLSQRLNQRLPGSDPILFCRCGLGQHDAVTGSGVPAYRGGNRAEIQRLRILRQTADRLPA